MAVDSESEVDFRKGSDNWLVLNAMAWSVNGKHTASSKKTGYRRQKAAHLRGHDGRTHNPRRGGR